MSRILSLVKVLIKNGGLFSSSKKNRDKKSKIRAIMMVFLIVFALAYFMLIIGFMGYNFTNALVVINQAGLVLSIAVLMVTLVTLVMNIFACLNVYYFSKDVEYILPMPFRPWEITIAKFITLLLTEYIVAFVIYAPLVVIYGILTGTGAMFYIMATLVFILIPIIPLIIGSLIIFILMSFSNLTKHKDKFYLLTGLIGIAFAMAIQFLPNQITVMEEDLSVFITSANSMVGILSRYFFTVGPATSALLDYQNIQGFLQLFVLIGYTAIALFIFAIVGSKLYLKGALSNNESSSKNKKIEFDKGYNKPKNPVISYMIKELKLLLRNPTYFMQCVLSPLIMPVLLYVIYMFNIGTLSGEDGGINLIEMVSLLNTNTTLFLVIIFCFFEFVIAMNYITITAISREGKSATFAKTLPMSYYKQLIAKMFPGNLLSIFSIFITIGLFKLVLDISIPMMLISFFACLAFAIFKGYLMILIDLKRPKLNWDTEMAVVKQNMNFLFEFLVSMVIIGIVILLNIFVAKDLPYLVTGAILTVVGIIGTIVMDSYFRKNQDRLYDRII